MPTNPYDPKDQPKPDPKLDLAFRRLNTVMLSPLEEVLFQSWTKANGIEEPDNPEGNIDYRSIYQTSGGKVFPHNELKQAAEIGDSLFELMKPRPEDEGYRGGDSMSDLMED